MNKQVVMTSAVGMVYSLTISSTICFQTPRHTENNESRKVMF